jgi:hypothetical protein
MAAGIMKDHAKIITVIITGTMTEGIMIAVIVNANGIMIMNVSTGMKTGETGNMILYNQHKKIHLNDGFFYLNTSNIIFSHHYLL